jgi:Tol biopolymer transport system component
MLRSQLSPLRGGLVITAVVLAACGSSATPAPTQAPAATAAPVATAAPTAVASASASPAPSVAIVPLPGERIAYGVRAGDSSYIVSQLADGSDLVRLTNAPGHQLCAAFSPDASQIIYCASAGGPFEIWTMRADGTNQTQVTNLGGRALFPDMSPDGSKFVFAGTEGTDEHTEVYVVDATGGNLVALTSCADGKAGCANDYPAWSPDGKQIVFSHQDDADADDAGINQQIWVMNADGSKARALTTGPEPKDQLADWNPDGGSIAYASGTSNNEGIWVMRADGTKPKQISGCVAGDVEPCAAGTDIGPAWSPDGKSIAFVRGFGAVGSDDRPVFVMNADGTGQRRLSPEPILAAVPAWR